MTFSFSPVGTKGVGITRLKLCLTSRIAGVCILASRDIRRLCQVGRSGAAPSHHPRVLGSSPFPCLSPYSFIFSASLPELPCMITQRLRRVANTGLRVEMHVFVR